MKLDSWFNQVILYRCLPKGEKTVQENRPVTTSSGTPVRHSSGTPKTAPKPKLLDRLRGMIYTHVLNRGPAGVRSPVDGL